jgi:hypothetical protein
MTPDRWRQITELFHAVRGRDPAQRDALLAGACREDPALQREVAAMLAGDEEAGASAVHTGLPPRTGLLTGAVSDRTVDGRGRNG